ncbi:MAG: DUF1553 domain-containing protein [Planctomycetaceae bacterium]
MVIASVLGTSAAAQEQTSRSATLSDNAAYERQIKPLLKRRCFVCHGRLHQKSGLRLDTVASIRRGGESGPAITAGKAQESLLVQVLDGSAGFRMPPPAEGPPLAQQEIALIKNWIRQGAPAPKDERSPPDPRSYWSYQQPQRPEISSEHQTAWTRNPIDSLIHKARDERGLSPRPPAKPHVLLRRVYLDLIGLPPTVDALQTFLADPSDAAYEQIVDDLLNRPQYGERWGRHWMDVWRYSDWYGSRAGNEIRYSQRHIWRWRDWIVESLNRDAGYDQMLIEMIAGDELEPGKPDTVRATGYLGRNWYKFDRDVWMFDAVEHTAQAFLGLTLRCARCHDHKFDPISHQDYYRFRAFFEPHHVRTDRVPGNSETQKDSKLGQVLKNGLSRVYDKQIDAPTYVFLRGDPRNPDKSEQLQPAVPAALGALQSPIAPIDLPLESFYPALQSPIVQDLLDQAHHRIATTLDTIKQGERNRIKIQSALDSFQTVAGQSSTEPDSNVFLHDTFDKSAPATWNALNGTWTYRDGAVVESEVTSFATLVTRKNHPKNMQVHLKYRALKPGTYRSIGFSFDYLDGGNSQDVYTSTNDTRQTVQAFHRIGGKQAYPPKGIVPVSLAVGQVVDLDVAIRDTQIKIRLNGKDQLTYTLPVPRRPGKFALWVHKGSAEFLELKIKQDQVTREELETKRLLADHKLAVDQLDHTVAIAALNSLKHRIAAERTRYSQQADPELYLVAGAAQQKLALAKAERKRLEARQHLMLQRRDNVPKKSIQQAQTQLKTAEKAVESARMALTKDRNTYEPLGTVHPRQSTGRRLALARWIANRSNPRTARVAINQMWLRHFAQPLVPSGSDCGLHGQLPPHPELLDWLAVEFMDRGWKMKPLHKLMVMSNTYRMSSRDSAEQHSLDPDNVLLWRMNTRRMEAEVVRDSLLFVAGALDLTLGGPEIPENQGQKTLRRSLYFRNTPNEKMPFLELFDVADPNACYRRAESIVPQQSLAMTNSALALGQSRVLSETLMTPKSSQEDSISDRELINAAYERILTRRPDSAEMSACQRFLERQIARFTNKTKTNPVFPGQSPASRPAASNPRQRAFENLVLVLFNHNDFVTVR